MDKILVTGGAGFIGSHVVKELIAKSFSDILVVDNLSKGRKEAVLTPAKLVVADLKNLEEITRVVSDFKPDIIMHFAAAKLADESVLKPEKYYLENVVGGLNLLSAMRKANVKNIIFSSTAAVYGDVSVVPIDEKAETRPVNPYGWSKLMFEQILDDYCRAYGINSVSLRYFNAGGADIDGKLGNWGEVREDLVSVLMQVASKNGKFTINGTDYETRDGSCIRDLVHVNDLASAHVLAIAYLKNNKGSIALNLGSETGYSVKEAVQVTKDLTGRKFEVIEGERRKGDIITSIASSEKAKKILGWNQRYSSLETIIKTAWDWEQKRD